MTESSPTKRAKPKHLALWVAWTGASLLLAAWLANAMWASEDKTVFMPGPLTDGHHQLADRCDACHTDAFGGGEVLQQACIDCHGKDREKPQDSHPRSKFKDPRNADRLANINALECTACHSEHKPEITLSNGLTQPQDVCLHCHADVADERPSHKDMDFMTCKNSGCHNYHNNRALYTDFLIKHLEEPDLLDKRVLPKREFADVLDEIVEYPRDRYPVQPLSTADADGKATDDVHEDWLASNHAKAGVNCSACHLITESEGVEPVWTDHPGEQGCNSCHSHEVDRFKQGKHGMRLSVGLSAMTPAQARLPMQDANGHESLSCNSCHGAHRFDTRTAAVEACLDCHADEHSVAYVDSPHHDLWKQESVGELPEGSGVSCASCHMPRINYDVSDWLSRTLVDHNQNASLSPNSKMIRPACAHCHGLDFTLKALADPAMVNNNFVGSPTTNAGSGIAGSDAHASMALAAAEKRHREEKAQASGDDDAGMFGF